MLKLTTTVYKYRRNAPLIIIAVAIGTIVSFLVAPPLNLIGFILIIAIAIYAAINSKSIFSPRTVDEKTLSFSAGQIQWGTWILPIPELENIEINIYAFDNFRHNANNRRRKICTTEYGDRNTLTFRYRGNNYELTFYLGTFEHYESLVQILQMWRENGVNFTAKSMFTDAYIREQVKLYG